jgi:hypothetical protein
VGSGKQLFVAADAQAFFLLLLEENRIIGEQGGWLCL